MSATSIGLPKRPAGILAFIGSPRSGLPQCSSPMGVRITVGQTELIWMLYFAHSTHITLVRVLRAPFDAPYAAGLSWPMTPACEEMLMILPPPFLIIAGTRAWARRNGARRLTAMVASQSDAVASSSGAISAI